MKTSALIALAASAKLAFAHATIYAAWINGEDQGLGNTDAGYIRSPPNNNPIKDVTSKDLTCNVNNAATAKTLSVAAGDEFTFEWHHNDRSAGDDIIASSHKGPVLVYMAPTETGTAGDGWVKIYEDGYDASTGKWAVDTLIENKGKHSITIPDVKAGEYLLRAEIIALHEANNVGGAQLYMECAQIKVTSEGTTTLPAGDSIPGIYTAEDAGIHFNMYGDLTEYPIPGPALWDGASSAPAEPAPAKSSASASVAESSAPATSAPVPATTAAPATSAAPAPVSSAVEKVEVSSAAPAPTTAAQTSAAAPASTTLATIVKPATSAAAPAATSAASSSGSAPKYGRCGGKGYEGPTTCAEGWYCKVQNPYYSQCVASA